MRAIETMYAGTLIRSRLEARWAVFFDELGIEWEFEPEGFDVSWRLSRWTDEEATFRYLPDFWLSDHGLWAEVKGSLTIPETERLLNAAASLSSNDGGGCHDNGGHDVLMLGPMPRPDNDDPVTPWLMHMHKGDLQLLPWNPFVVHQSPGRWDHASTDRGTGFSVAYDVGGSWNSITDIVNYDWAAPSPDDIPETLLKGAPAALDYSSMLNAAYSAARSARFEHSHREVWKTTAVPTT